MAPISRSKITVKIDDKDVDLEDAFKVFEKVFEGMDETFDNMEIAFKAFDKNIHSKINEVKKRTVLKKSHKYEYVPDPDEDVDERFESMLHERETLVRKKKAALNMVIICSVLVGILSFAVIFFTLTSKKDAEFGDPSKTQPSITEQLEKLE